MTIDELISREAPSDSEHDKAYAEQLKRAYARYQSMSKDRLKIEQRIARIEYGKNMATHQDTANCVVIYNLLGGFLV
jgi:hypothetical protein